MSEVLDAWSFAHADPDATLGLEACAKWEGPLSRQSTIEIVREAVFWWLANPTLQTWQ